MGKAKKLQPIKSVVKTTGQTAISEQARLHDAAQLLQQHRASKEKEAMEALQVVIAKWENEYNATFSIGQPQIIVQLK